MNEQPVPHLTGELLDEGSCLSLAELARACQVPAEIIVDLVEIGVLEPRARVGHHWQFHYTCIHRLQRALRLERDLGVNRAGAALAMDLLDELSELRARVRRLEGPG